MATKETVAATIAAPPEVQRLHGAVERLALDPDWGLAVFSGPHSDDKYRKMIEARGDVQRALGKLQYLLDGTRRW